MSTFRNDPDFLKFICDCKIIQEYSYNVLTMWIIYRASFPFDTQSSKWFYFVYYRERIHDVLSVLQENNIEADATLEMSLRLIGEMEKKNEQMDTHETEEDIEKKRSWRKKKKEGKMTKPNDDTVYLRRDIMETLNRSDEKNGNLLKKDRRKKRKLLKKKTEEKMDDFSRKADDMLEKFMQVTSTVGSQIQGMNSSIKKMKDMNEKNERRRGMTDTSNSTKYNHEKRKKNPGHGWKIREPKSSYQKRTCWWESRKNSDNRISQWNDRVRGYATLERIGKWSRNGLRKRKNWMSRKTDHTCIHSLHKRWRKKHIYQVDEHVEKRTGREEKLR